MGDNGKAKWTRKRIKVEGDKHEREVRLSRFANDGGAQFGSLKPLKFRPFADISIKL